MNAGKNAGKSAGKKAERKRATAAGTESGDSHASVWAQLWTLVNRANVAVQLVAGAVLLLLVDLDFMLHIRLGWSLGPPNQPWPTWITLAIPIVETLLWLTLAILAIVVTYRQWQRQRQSAPQQQRDPGDAG